MYVAKVFAGDHGEDSSSEKRMVVVNGRCSVVTVLKTTSISGTTARSTTHNSSSPVIR